MDEIKRTRYFQHEILDSDDFIDEQEYHRNMRYLHNSRFHTWGIMEGLEVNYTEGQEPGNETIVTVSIGTAVDGKGREMVLPESKTIDFNQPDYAGGNSYYITIRWNQQEGLPQQQDKFKRWEEIPQIDVSEEEPLDKNMNLVLARVTLRNDKTVDIIDLSERKDASSEIAEGHIGTVELADGSVSESKIAVDAVTNSKISDGSVSENKLDAVTQDKLVTGGNAHTHGMSQLSDYNANNNKILNLGDPTEDKDAANKRYVDDNTGAAGTISSNDIISDVTTYHSRQINVSRDSSASEDISQVNASHDSTANGQMSQVNASENSTADTKNSQVNASRVSTASGERSQVNASDNTTASGDRSQVNASKDSNASGNISQVNASSKSTASGDKSQVNASEASTASFPMSQVNASYNSGAGGKMSQVNASDNSTASGTYSQVNASNKSEANIWWSQVNASESSTASGNRSQVNASTGSNATQEMSQVNACATSNAVNLWSQVNASVDSTASGVESQVNACQGSTANGDKSQVNACDSSTASGAKSQVNASGISAASGDYSQVNASFNSTGSGGVSQVNASEDGTASGHMAQVNASKYATASGIRSQVNASGESTASGEGAQVNASSTSIQNGNYAQITASLRVANNSNYTLCGGYSSGGSASTANRKWEINSQNGDITYLGALKTTLSDYGEYFENLKKGVINMGVLIALEGDKVRPAKKNEDFIGVVSGTAAIRLGDSPFCWQGRYLKDEWGRPVYQEIKDPHWEPKTVPDEKWKPKKGQNEADRPMVPVETEEDRPLIRVQKENPDYDPKKEQKPRSERPEEWTLVGLLGQVYVRCDGTVKPGDFVKSKGRGMGTKSEEKTRLRAMKVTKEYDGNYSIVYCLLI